MNTLTESITIKHTDEGIKAKYPFGNNALLTKAFSLNKNNYANVPCTIRVVTYFTPLSPVYRDFKTEAFHFYGDSISNNMSIPSLIPATIAWVIMDQFVGEILTDANRTSDSLYFNYDDEGFDPIAVPVHYDHPVLLCVTYDDGYFRASHINCHGHLMAGNNIDAEGSLCLNETIDPFNVNWIHAFLNNTPNSDYNWRGDEITGDSKIGGGFNITDWPSDSSWTIPNVPVPNIVVDQYNKFRP